MFKKSSKKISKSTKSKSVSETKTSERKVVITVSHLSKTFKLPTERSFGLKQVIFNRLRGIKGYTEQQVLNDVSFKVYDGEFLGIVGRNGSGKSTLLKLLSKIYTPTKGDIEIDGSLVPFIELGVGFNPELTGRENVYLNGAMLGFSNQEMDAMYDDLVKRLAFSIAIRARGDILILDEVLAVGDAAFQKKCNDYFASLHGKQTVILVTHSMENVMAYCDRAILIEKGKIIEEGEPAKITEAYLKLFNLNS